MRVDSWKCYITPFLDSGEYGTEVEVTQDIVFNSIGNVQRAFDNSEYSIGILRNSSFSITLNNRDGVYSDIDVTESMFRFTRSKSKFRLTYSYEENDNTSSNMVAGQSWLCAPVDVFVGLIDDNAASTNIKNHLMPLSVLGLESIFDTTPVPFSDISNGDSIADTIFNLLNQSAITALMTVDISNIVPGEDQTIDTKDPYENQTVTRALSDLLLASNSVLYIDDGVVYVSARTAGVDVQKTFYGQASLQGQENITSIDNIRSGFAKIFNFLTWQSDPTILVTDGDSVLRYGVKKTALDIGFFTTGAKIEALLGAILVEFANPKQEFVLTTKVTYEVLALRFLNRVTIDYPLMVIPDAGHTLPVCGIVVCGVGILPRRLSNFNLDPPTDFKIMNIEVSVKTGEVKFKMRKI